jgi:hypothetical protein
LLIILILAGKEMKINVNFRHKAMHKNPVNQVTANRDTNQAAHMHSAGTCKYS